MNLKVIKVISLVASVAGCVLGLAADMINDKKQELIIEEKCNEIISKREEQ